VGKESMDENWDRVSRADEHGRKVGKRVGQRRKTEKVADRKKVVWAGTGPWSPEVAPNFLIKTFWVLVPGAGDVEPGLGGM
jgi:hypothetical protein